MSAVFEQRASSAPRLRGSEDETIRELSGFRIAAGARPADPESSLVVPTYRRHRQVTEQLDVLAGLADSPDEVVVVDGEAGGELGRVLSQWRTARSAPFDLVYVESPKGLTRQRNVGIDISRGSTIYFFDDDILPHSGYFDAIRSVFAADPERQIGAVGGIIPAEMTGKMPRRWKFRLAIGLVPDRPAFRYLPCGTSTPKHRVTPFTGIREVNILSGGVSAWRREVFDHERFSEFFESYAQGEDMEMALRVSRNWRVVCCGDARVNHLHTPGGRPRPFAKGRMELLNRYFIWKRHAGRPGLLDRVRFWLDAGLITGMDIAWWCARPNRTDNLAHAAGIVSAVWSCWFSPPRYEEPPARRRYRVASDAALSSQ